MSLQDARKRCVSSVVQSQDFACIQLVYGAAGKEGAGLVSRSCDPHVMHILYRGRQDPLH